MSRVDQGRGGVNRALWAEAVELAGGDPDRIEVCSPTSVVVHNTADWTRAGGRRRASQPKPSTPPKQTAQPKPQAHTSQPHTSQRGSSAQSAQPAALPLPEWRSAAPARVREHTRARAKSDVPAFLAPASERSAG